MGIGTISSPAWVTNVYLNGFFSLALCIIKLLFVSSKVLWVPAPALFVFNFYLVIVNFWVPILTTCVQMISLMMTSSFTLTLFSMLIHLHSNYPTRLFLVSYKLAYPGLSIKTLVLVFHFLKQTTLGFWVTLSGPLDASCLPLVPVSFTNLLVSHVSHSAISMAHWKNPLRGLTPPFTTQPR